MRWILTVVMLGSSALAATTPEECASIEVDTDRLACFDLLFPPATDSPSAAAGWDVEVRRSDLDGRTDVFLLTESRQPHITQSGARENLDLAIMCRDNETSVSLQLGGERIIDLQNGRVVTYQVDDGPEHSRPFLVSFDQKVLGLKAASAIAFARELFGGQSLSVHVRPWLQSSVTGEFNIAGLEEAIRPLREACQW
jgi:type VI secretion system protein VasI